jgi:hypothetical protein
MADLAALSDDDLAWWITQLRKEQLRRKGKSHTCGRCGTRFMARAGARYCSAKCRVAACRARDHAGTVARREDAI